MVVAFVSDRISHGLIRQTEESSRHHQLHMQQIPKNTDAIVAMNLQPSLKRGWLHLNSVHALNIRAITLFQQNTALISRTIRQLIQVLMLGAGAVLVLEQSLTPGGMIAASIIMARALAPFEKSITNWRQFNEARMAYQNLKQILAVKTIEVDHPQTTQIKGYLTLDHIIVVPPFGKHNHSGPMAPILNSIKFN